MQSRMFLGREHTYETANRMGAKWRLYYLASKVWEGSVKQGADLQGSSHSNSKPFVFDTYPDLLRRVTVHLLLSLCPGQQDP